MPKLRPSITTGACRPCLQTSVMHGCDCIPTICPATADALREEMTRRCAAQLHEAGGWWCVVTTAGSPAAAGLAHTCRRGAPLYCSAGAAARPTHGPHVPCRGPSHIALPSSCHATVQFLVAGVPGRCAGQRLGAGGGERAAGRGLRHQLDHQQGGWVGGRGGLSVIVDRGRGRR